jgi:transposase
MIEYGNLKMKEEPLLGENPRSERMFYYVRMEEMVPENHVLRLINKHIDFGFIRNKVKHMYSHTGRPSIDPEVVLRILLIGYLYGITSERRLCEEVQMHIGYRWFVGLNLEDKVPDHSTFSKNRHERFSESDVFEKFFDEIVNQCVSKGLLTGKHLTVDSTYVRANAALKSLEPIVVRMDTGEYIEKLERENPVEEGPWEPGDDYPHRGQKISNGTHRSKTDPDARLARKSMKANTHLYHGVTYVMDNRSRIIVGTDVGKPDRKTDCEKALRQIRRIPFTFRMRPKSLGADKGYSTGEFIDALIKEKVQPHIPIMDYRSQNDRGIYPIESFSFDPEENRFLCPDGKELRYWGIHKRSKQYVYRARKKDCAVCPRKAECTRDTARSVSYHIYEDSINQARHLNQTRAYRISQRMRKRIEELFGEAKEWMGLRRAKFRRRKFIREQVLMTATAQNIKRMVTLLSRRGPAKQALAARQAVESFLSKILFDLFIWLHRNINRSQFATQGCS